MDHLRTLSQLWSWSGRVVAESDGIEALLESFAFVINRMLNIEDVFSSHFLFAKRIYDESAVLQGYCRQGPTKYNSFIGPSRYRENC